MSDTPTDVQDRAPSPPTNSSAARKPPSIGSRPARPKAAGCPAEVQRLEALERQSVERDLAGKFSDPRDFWREVD